MPLFKFKHSKKSKEVPKKASSMNNIYNDYSCGGGGSGGSVGAAKKEVNFEETDEIKQFNGRFTYLINFPTWYRKTQSINLLHSGI